MDHQAIAEPKKPMFENKYWQYYKFNDEIYRIHQGSMVFDVDSGYPVGMRWECPAWQWDEYKKAFLEVK